VGVAGCSYGAVITIPFGFVFSRGQALLLCTPQIRLYLHEVEWVIDMLAV